jgi:hypothetical protein
MALESNPKLPWNGSEMMGYVGWNRLVCNLKPHISRNQGHNCGQECREL